MPSFSEMFPTYARWFSKIGSLVATSRPGTRAAGQPRQGPRPDGMIREERAAADTATQEPAVDFPAGEIAGPADSILTAPEAASDTASEAVSRSTTAAPAPVSPPGMLTSDETQISQMYQTWVELDNGVAQAHEDLRRILNSRGKAALLRSQARETLEQAEAVREEAQRIGDAAWRAFDRGFATKITGFANRRAMVREIDQSRRTQAELQRNAHKNAWEEAERSREAATAQVLKALDALAMVADQVERELVEAASLPKMADALQEAAQEELRCAEAVKDELLLLGREALNQLGVTPTSDHEYVMPEPPARETGIPEPGSQGLILGDETPGVDTGPQPLARETPSLERMPDQPQADPDSLSLGAESTEAPTDALEVHQVSMDASGDAPAATDSGGVVEMAASSSPAQDLLREMEEARAFVESSPSAAIPVPEPAPPESDQPPSPWPKSPLEGEIIFPQGGAATPEPSQPADGRPSAAEQLIRDMEAARAAMHSLQPSPAVEAPNAAQGQIRDMQPFDSQPIEAHPRTASQPPASNPGQSAEASYSGRLYLMFPSNLTQDEMGTVWEALEDAARGNQILDSRLLSALEGIQFTVKLGAAGLAVQNLSSRLPGAEFEGLGPDRLKVNWPKR